MKNVRLIRKDESAVSPVIATILMVAITVVLAAVLYVMVSGLITSPGGQVRAIGINPSSSGSNYALLFTSVPSGLGKDSTFILIRDSSGAIACQRTALNLLTDGGETGCLNVTYSPVTGGANIEVQDTVLILKSRYAAGAVVEISDAAGILARQTLT